MQIRGDWLPCLSHLTDIARQVARFALSPSLARGYRLPALAVARRRARTGAIADVAERVIDAVVNISTSQSLEAQVGAGAAASARLAVRGILRRVLQEPARRRRQRQAAQRAPRRVNSLGSGFIIEPPASW